MSISRKAEKRRIRKEKKRQELEKKLTEEKVKFDILDLLLHELLDTKPNMAKFLKQYVQLIRCHNNGKLQFYPSFKYEISRIFVRFLDGHELIYDMMTDGKFTPKYYYFSGVDEIELTDRDNALLDQFFEYLVKFKFVY